jgi:hypothetical protein
MKFLPVLFLFLISINSFSNENKHKDMKNKIDNMSFEDAKKMKLEMLEKKSAMMEQEHKCVVAANDKSALRECMKDMKEMHDDMKNEMKDKNNK